MRFIATSDWHLGKTAGFLRDDPRARYQEARFDAVEQVGKLARDKDAQFIAVAGDVFDANNVGRSPVNKMFEALRAAAPIPVYLLPGNHDPLDAATIYDSPDFLRGCPDHVHVIRDTTPIDVGPGLELVGVPWHTKFPSNNIFNRAVKGLDEVPAGVQRVIVAHGATGAFGGDEDAETLISPDVAVGAIRDRKADFVALGDRHSVTEVAPNVWYSGSPEVTDRTDIDAGNVLVVDLPAASSGSGAAQVESVRVGSWRYQVVGAELEDEETVDALVEELDKLNDKRTTLAYLKLTGALTIAQRARLDDELDRLADVFALLEVWESHSDLGVLPDDQDFSSLGLSGFASDAVRELLEGADLGDRVAEDALKLLYRFGMGTKQ